MHHFYLKNKELYVEDVSLGSLAKQYGTPLYVYSANTLRHHVQSLKNALKELDHEICFAVKANSNLAVLNLLAKEGVSFDVVSIGELFRVTKAGGNPAKCVFAGVGKRREEIEQALKDGIYALNIESEAELNFINSVAQSVGKVAPISFRVNPNVNASTHAKITTGTYANKFGIAYELVQSLYEKAAKLKHVRLRGVHMHIGSQITTLKPFVQAVKKMIPLVQILKQKFGIEFFDVGGGFGVVYEHALASGQSSWWKKHKSPPLTPAVYAQAVVPLLKKLGMKIMIEPGRFITGNAGVLLSEVLYVKETGKKRFVIVDAAMNDLIRPSFYDAYHEIVSLKAPKGRQVPTDIVGPVCESGDVFCKDRPLPLFKAGDRLAFMTAGAYSFVMASNYNSRPRPAELLVDGAEVKVVRERESLKDLIKGESIP